MTRSILCAVFVLAMLPTVWAQTTDEQAKTYARELSYAQATLKTMPADRTKIAGEYKAMLVEAKRSLAEALKYKYTDQAVALMTQIDSYLNPQASAPPQPPAAAENPKDSVPAIVAGSNAFATDLYARLAAKEKGNILFAPGSIDTALAMTYAGAAGRTAKEMAQALHFTLASERLHPAFADLLKQLNAPPDVLEGKNPPLPPCRLAVANSLSAQRDYGFKSDFTQLLQKSYGSAINEVDFAQTEQARTTINDWVAKATGDKIKDLIPSGCIDNSTRLVLANAVYFKGNWTQRFSTDATQKASFDVSYGHTIDDVPMMHAEKTFNYMENDDLGLLELPYVGDRLSMIVILPRPIVQNASGGLPRWIDTLPGLEKKLTAANIDKWLGQKKATLVKVTLPKFTMTQSFMLAGALKELGMSCAFDPDKANFSGMTDKTPLFISEVVHKAFIAVDEEGTEAAAATAVIGKPGAAPHTQEPKVFTADHPFVFIIRHNPTGEILFMGRLIHPL